MFRALEVTQAENAGDLIKVSLYECNELPRILFGGAVVAWLELVDDEEHYKVISGVEHLIERLN